MVTEIVPYLYFQNKIIRIRIRIRIRICTNDLIIVSDKLKKFLIMYADDTTIYFNLEDFDRYNLQQDITNELENIT